MIDIILSKVKNRRLLTISKEFMPETFLKLLVDKFLFQLIVQRNYKIYNCQHIYSNAEQNILIINQLNELNKICNKFLFKLIRGEVSLNITLFHLMRFY